MYRDVLYADFAGAKKPATALSTILKLVLDRIFKNYFLGRYLRGSTGFPL